MPAKKNAILAGWAQHATDQTATLIDGVVAAVLAKLDQTSITVTREDLAATFTKYHIHREVGIAGGWQITIKPFEKAMPPIEGLSIGLPTLTPEPSEIDVLKKRIKELEAELDDAEDEGCASDNALLSAHKVIDALRTSDTKADYWLAVKANNEVAFIDTDRELTNSAIHAMVDSGAPALSLVPVKRLDPKKVVT